MPGCLSFLLRSRITKDKNILAQKNNPEADIAGDGALKREKATKLSNDPVLTDLIDLRNPCGGTGGSRSEAVDGVPFDIQHILESSKLEIAAIKNKFTKKRITGRSRVRFLNTIPFQPAQSFSTQPPEDLETVWRTALKYIVYIRHLRRNEIMWSHHRKRSPTFQNDFHDLEANKFGNLLCALNSFAHAYNVTFPEEYITHEIDTIQYTPAQTHNDGDNIAYVILNNYEKDFVPFAKDFFAALAPES